MNALLLNPFAHDTPDNVERVLYNVQASCLRFNRGAQLRNPAEALLFAGSYLAAGRIDGVVTIWDPHTAGILRWLEGHAGTVTALAWSRCNRFLASASVDHSVIVWDLHPSAEVLSRVVRFDGPVASVEFDPSNSSIILVVLSASQEAVMVDLQPRFQVTRTRAVPSNPAHRKGPDSSASPWSAPSIQPLPPRRWRFGSEALPDGGKSPGVACACFVAPPLPASASVPEGTAPTSEGPVYILAATQKGGLDIYDAASRTLIQSEPAVFGTSATRQLVYHAGYGLLVANGTDRKIKVVDFHLASPAVSAAGDDGRDVPGKKFDVEPKYLFQDQIGRTRWNGIGLSADGEYIYAGAANAEKHSVYVWGRVLGRLHKTIDGPKDALVDVDWHPARPAMASLSRNGDVHLWSVPSEENWSAYAPGFEELEENMEYEEREREFDVEDEDEANQRQHDEEVATVDIYPPGQAAQQANCIRTQSHPASPPSSASRSPLHSDPFWAGTPYAYLPDAVELGEQRLQERPCPAQEDAVEQTSTRIVAFCDPDNDTTFRIPPVLEEEPIELQSDSSD